MTTVTKLRLLDSTSDVMDALGGNQIVATITGRSAKAVSNWRGFDTFPSDTYVVMLAALNAKGFSASASLWRMVDASARASA